MSRESPKPGSRISIYSPERARFERAIGLPHCQCRPLCTPTVLANASGAIAKLVSAGKCPSLRRVGVELPGDASRLLERNVRIGAQGQRLPFPVAAIVASCLPLKLSADRKFPYDVFALAFEASANY